VLGGAGAVDLFFVGSQLLGGMGRAIWVDVGWIVFDGAVALACVAARRAVTDRWLRLAWTLFAAGAAFWTLSSTAFLWKNVIVQQPTGVPSLSHYLGWTGGGFLLGGVFCYRQGNVSAAWTLRQVADLGLIAGSLAGFAIEALYPRVIATGASVTLVVAGMVTPALGGLALINGLLGMPHRSLGERRRVLAKILLGMAVLAGVGTLYIYYLLGGTIRVGPWIDTVGIAGMLLIGWAALDDRWHVHDEPAADSRANPPGGQVPVAMAAAWMAVVITVGASSSVALWPLRAVVVSVLTVAMMLRVWTNQRLAVELQQRVAEEERRRWQLETQLVKAQKLEALGTVAGGVAHDFNNVLAAANATLYLARRKLASGADAGPDLAEAERIMQRAAGLTERLLGLANNRGQRRRSIDVGAIVDQVAGMLGKVMPPGLHVAVDVTPELPHIVADPIGLEHALLNLGLNARDALRDHGGSGAITLIARLGAADGEVVVEVADDGPGISPDVLPRLFEPFFTTKPDGQGTGLGLAMVKTFADANGISLSVDSKVGAGARFRLACPVPPAQA
jgi:signal transduction histidine kinase